jgi:uncharacterized iron-regulated membrane protein
MSISFKEQTKENTQQQAEKESKQISRHFYHSVWRWHFYAGLFVVPFLLVLAVTGLIMLYQPVLEIQLEADKYYVEPASQVVSIEYQKQQVMLAYSGTIKKFIPAKTRHLSNQFIVKSSQGINLKVFVNPYTGQVLGDINLDASLYAISNDIHGSLLLGDFGDRIMELTASFTVLLAITGSYLWWPKKAKTAAKGNRFIEAIKIRKKNGKRAFWRDLHGVTGLSALIFLVFFSISGLAWSGIWGGQLVQAWSSFPMEKRASNFNSKPVVEADDIHANHKSLNTGVIETMPWNLELSPLPTSGSSTGISGIAETEEINLDSVFRFAKAVGFSQFQISLPSNDTGVYTLSANTMSGDIQDASEDRTLHLDQYTGNILADIGYADYNLMAKSMALGIALHQANFSLWNLVINTFACALIILLCVSGIYVWWLRRPSQSRGLNAPAIPANLSRWKNASLLMLGLSLFLPLAALCLISLIIMDAIFVRFMPSIKRVYQ